MLIAVPMIMFAGEPDTMFSRVRSFTSLYIMATVIVTRTMLNKVSKKKPVLDSEFDRLKALSVQTIAALHDQVDSGRPPLTDAHVAPPSPGPSPNSAASADGSSASSSPSAGPSPNPAASLDGPVSKGEIDLVLRGLTIMFDPSNGLAELQDQDPDAIYVRFTDFAQFLRESPPTLAAFPNIINDDYLADVLSDALRLYPNSEWVCFNNDDCNGDIFKT
jgi:hypothetical protein